MIKSISKKSPLNTENIFETLSQGLADKFRNQRLLVLIPDHTRSLPLPTLFRAMVDILRDTSQLDFLVALGTHPPLSANQLCNLVGISPEERSSTFKEIGLFNHAWDDPCALTQIGTLPQNQIQQIAGDIWHPSLGGDVPVRINKAALAYDHILILGPTFPHEVVGYSGGAKYIFPGISGAEMINATHWLGALAGVVGTIGIAKTPVREMIHQAAALLKTAITLIALVGEGDGIAGLFIGDHVEAWQAAAELSAERHIKWCAQPFQQVLSCAPAMYDELWTAAKAMYKLEAVVADGGELIIFAPHLDEVSYVHGGYIHEIGYHVLDYFLAQWSQFEHIPLGVLAHSTHMRGAGQFINGRESPRVKVSLASRIPPNVCEALALSYRDPKTIDPNQWKNREDEGILYVPKAGEMLYKIRN